jgi:hypothetical protein
MNLTTDIILIVIGIRIIWPDIMKCMDYIGHAIKSRYNKNK